MTDLVPTKPTMPAKASIFDLHPQEQIAFATQVATALSDVIKTQKLFQVFQGKEYVVVEGWTTLGMLLGILPVEDHVERLANGSYVAYVKLLRARDGVQVGGASSLCGIDEKRWAKADEYARRSMAVTRATGKAFRLGYSWIMRLAGYEATPYEEMPLVTYEEPKETAKAKPTTETQLDLPLCPDALRGLAYEGTEDQRAYMKSVFAACGLTGADSGLIKRGMDKLAGDDMTTIAFSFKKFVEMERAK